MDGEWQQQLNLFPIASINFLLSLPSCALGSYWAKCLGPNLPRTDSLTGVRGNYLTNILKLIDMDIYTSTDQTWLNSPKH